MRSLIPEIAKPLLLVAVFAACAVAEHLPFIPAILLSIFHVGGLAICGELITTAAGLPPSASTCDRIVVDYLAGWCFAPVLALGACLTGTIGAEAIILVLFCGAWATLLHRKSPQSPQSPAGKIPFSLYLVASMFALVTAAPPFSAFSDGSILREFYGDGVQRFGVIYALSEGVPPRNPFFTGAPLRYYWLWMVPYAGEYRYLWGDLFTVWKCGQTWTALTFPLGLWFLLKELLDNGRAAYMAVLFALVFTSYEIFAHPSLMQGIATLMGLPHAASSGMIIPGDPDFILGILQPYSDQLLSEDFWYIPQNSYAIIVTLVAICALKRGRAAIGALILSSLIGINTFFAPPAFTGFLVVSLALYGMRSFSSALCIMVGGGIICALMCNMADPNDPVPWVILCAVILAFLAVRWIKNDQECYSPGNEYRYWSTAVLTSFACILALSPLHNTLTLFLAYSPSILFALYFLVQITRKRVGVTPLILFLMVFLTVYALMTIFLSFQQIAAAPEWFRNTAIYAGREVNLFNFYHKAGKMVRIAWAVFGAVGLNLLIPHLELISRKSSWPVIAGFSLLFLSAVTPIFRPFTYLGHGRVTEAAAASYLRGVAGNRTLLIEDFRASQINQLAPVEVFYYSQWSNGNMALNTLEGHWSDQYLPAAMRRLSGNRESQVNRFFTGPDPESRKAFLKHNRIGFILTRNRYDLSGIADPVVEEPGGYLYRVRP